MASNLVLKIKIMEKKSSSFYELTRVINNRSPPYNIDK
jgi:hypothetical protein